MKLGAMRGLTAGICLMAALSLTAATPAQAGEARSGGSAAKRVGPLLLAWGDNFDGELGDGTVIDRHAPVAVNPPAGLKATSARVGSFAAAVTPSGQLMAWGRGTEGELGNGAMKDRHRPVQVKPPRASRSRRSGSGSTSRWR
jgi:alpha-tubulin suppressor-like RCC1 family protein